MYTRQSEGFTLACYCDTSHGREMHRAASGFCKSRSGGCIAASGASIHAFSQVQQPTALQTFESELTALVLRIRNMLALRRLPALMLGASLPASVVHCANMSVIMQLHKRDLSARARHIRTNLGFDYGDIDDGDIVVQHVRTMQNPTNTFTAAENHDRFHASVPASRVMPPKPTSTNKILRSINKLQPTCAFAHDVHCGGAQHRLTAPPQPFNRMHSHTHKHTERNSRQTKIRTLGKLPSQLFPVEL